MEAMHGFCPINRVKIMHSIGKVTKNHAYPRKRCNRCFRIMHSLYFITINHLYISAQNGRRMLSPDSEEKSRGS